MGLGTLMFVIFGSVVVRGGGTGGVGGGTTFEDRQNMVRLRRPLNRPSLTSSR